MKNIKLSLFITLLLFAFIGCESDINKVMISDNPGKPGLSDLIYTGQFNVANADSLITFSWEKADFGFSASTTYSLEISSVENFEKDVLSLFNTNDLTKKVKVSEINSALLAWEKELGKPATVYYRIRASVTPTNVIYSDVKNKSFSPFETLIEYPMIYIPGSYQGWSPGNENGRLYSYGFNTVYQGILRLVDGSNPNVEFKVTLAPNWNGTNYGGALTKAGNNYTGMLDASGGNLVAVANTYEFEVNMASLSIKLTKTDDWGLIGSATPDGWNSDTDMNYNGQRKMWELTVNLTVGDIKFRANNGWDVNLGGKDGILTPGGDNIPITVAGNYTIRLDTKKNIYTIKKN